MPLNIWEDRLRGVGAGVIGVSGRCVGIGNTGLFVRIPGEQKEEVVLS